MLLLCEENDFDFVQSFLVSIGYKWASGHIKLEKRSLSNFPIVLICEDETNKMYWCPKDFFNSDVNKIIEFNIFIRKYKLKKINVGL